MSTMENLPSTGDDTWDGHILELIDAVKTKKWTAALLSLNRMGREVIYRVKEVIEGG